MKNLIGSLLAILVFGMQQLKQWLLKLTEDDPHLQEGINISFGLPEGIFGILQDNDPDDGKQVKALLKNFFSRQDLHTWLANSIDSAIDKKVSDEVANEGLKLLADPVLDMVGLLSNDDPDNGDEIAKRFHELIAGEEFEKFMVNQIFRNKVLKGNMPPQVADYLADKVIGGALQLIPDPEQDDQA